MSSSASASKLSSSLYCQVQLSEKEPHECQDLKIYEATENMCNTEKNYNDCGTHEISHRKIRYIFHYSWRVAASAPNPQEASGRATIPARTLTGDRLRQKQVERLLQTPDEASLKLMLVAKVPMYEVEAA